MITAEVLEAFSAAFSNEKVAGAERSAQKTLNRLKMMGLLGAGAGAGLAGEQAKDDLFSGRRARQAQARSMGVNPMTL